MTKYARTSPWLQTAIVKNVLDIWQPRTIDTHVDDKIYQIDGYYNLRPDLLSYDLYQTPKLWWVFAQRNPTIIKDPIFDFYTGQIIMVTSPDHLKDLLGL